REPRGAREAPTRRARLHREDAVALSRREPAPCEAREDDNMHTHEDPRRTRGVAIAPLVMALAWSAPLAHALAVQKALRPRTSPPSVAANLHATNVTPTTVTLAWTPSTDDLAVARYRVYRDGVPVLVTSLTQATDQGLSPATTHAYTVAAIDVERQ